MAKGPIITLPPGIEIPDGTQEGDTFQAMATFRLLSATAYGSETSQVHPGQVQLVEIDGEPVGKEPRDLKAPARSDINQPSPSPGLRDMFGGGA